MMPQIWIRNWFLFLPDEKSSYVNQKCTSKIPFRNISTTMKLMDDAGIHKEPYVKFIDEVMPFG
jgi:hypothetical protein